MSPRFRSFEAEQGQHSANRAREKLVSCLANGDGAGLDSPQRVHDELNDDAPCDARGAKLVGIVRVRFGEELGDTVDRCGPVRRG